MVDRDSCLIYQCRRNTLICLECDNLVVLDDRDGGEHVCPAGKQEQNPCDCQDPGRFHESNYTLPDLIYDPYIWLDVNTLVLFSIYFNWIERTIDNVLAGLGKP